MAYAYNSWKTPIASIVTNMANIVVDKCSNISIVTSVKASIVVDLVV